MTNRKKLAVGVAVDILSLIIGICLFVNYAFWKQKVAGRMSNTSTEAARFSQRK